MTKYLLLLLLLSSCITPREEHLEGIVEEAVYFDNSNYIRHKVWCPVKNKYYYVITDKLYNEREIIQIK